MCLAWRAKCLNLFFSEFSGGVLDDEIRCEFFIRSLGRQEIEGFKRLLKRGVLEVNLLEFCCFESSNALLFEDLFDVQLEAIQLVSCRSMSWLELEDLLE